MKKFFLICLLFTMGLLAGAADRGKQIVSILGDSYSTFEGYIPEGNAPWYGPSNTKTNDVKDVRQTWWWQLISEGGYILGKNDSYSGATISYTGYRGEDYSDRSFITRLPDLGPADIILIFGGTNDSWCGAPLGEFVYSKLTRGHLFEFRPALGRLLTEAQNRYPGSRIVFIINSELKESITSSIVTECEKFGIEYIQLENIDKQSGHPSIKGMTAIKEQVLDFLKK